MAGQPIIYVDESHLGRFVTGLERITLELFSQEALAPLPIRPIRASGTARMIAAQTLRLPARLAVDRHALALCPGFPPSIPLSLFGARVIPYIHDCFLLTRPQDLNWRARIYMAPAFAHAVKRLPWFLANSETTRSELARFVRPDAEITLYRPRIRDVFGVADPARPPRVWRAGTPLRLIAIGTVEPRKNLAASAAIVAALRARGIDAHLDIVGRFGWGDETTALQADPHVTLHGYQEAEAVRALIGSAHALISTSHDEGLGLTLLEAQHGGLDVIASDLPVFREVLGASGLLVDPARPGEAADAIIARAGDLERAAALAAANLARWNASADQDRLALVERLQRHFRVLA
ncbi:glycosyltransferase [Kaistia dalseonensis]|uniref:Glycosyltransferase involved in cell wall biosynthesis n=1 Tax=Kaistia dalseonensis TaxID=410840 RepID=A0ABU0HAT0_9HYPH|nr:glycosyltransferase [Kaistia dalseonensis]MCX5495978.1 glycosyltransferase [Kaistia dalseonensis]MDQ0438581.1 glycosyltransferase involved in cell wall biosynthesis [Kaistia dalseonensis]